MTVRILLAAFLAGCVFLSGGCGGSGLEIHTESSVDMYRHAGRPTGPGNARIGTIPAGVTIPVIRQELLKDIAVYEVDYTSQNGVPARGFVILGTKGLIVRRATS